MSFLSDIQTILTDKVSILFQSALRSKPVRENFEVDSTAIETMAARIDALEAAISAPNPAAEVIVAREENTSLVDNLRSIKASLATYQYQVFSGLVVSESSTPAMTVDVSAGSAIVNGTGITYAGGTSGAITAAAAGKHRYDSVVVNTGGSVVVKTGTEVDTTDTRARPAILTSEKELAYIDIDESTSSITDALITDVRTLYARGVPFVTVGDFGMFDTVQKAIDYIVDTQSGNGIIHIDGGTYAETLTYTGVSKITLIFGGSVTIDGNTYTGILMATSSGIGGIESGEGNTASGVNSAAIGASNTASGDYSVALGESNTASGDNSVALGESNTASAPNSVAIGEGNAANNTYSAAIGRGNTVSGDSSVVLGGSNTASGTRSAAIGGGNAASGDNAAAIGQGCTADVAALVAVGKYNTGGAGKIFEVGIGADAGNLDDAITVSTDGLLTAHYGVEGAHRPSASIHASGVSQDTIFDALDPYIPDNNDEIILSGAIPDDNAGGMFLYCASRAKRISSTVIYIYVAFYDFTASGIGNGYLTINDGTASVFDYVSLAW